jgi:hypothetical protein
MSRGLGDERVRRGSRRERHATQGCQLTRQPAASTPPYSGMARFSRASGRVRTRRARSYGRVSPRVVVHDLGGGLPAQWAERPGWPVMDPRRDQRLRRLPDGSADRRQGHVALPQPNPRPRRDGHPSAVIRPVAVGGLGDCQVAGRDISAHSMHRHAIWLSANFTRPTPLVAHA